MNEKPRLKRIIILTIIILCILGIIFLLIKSTYKINQEGTCKKCLCLGIIAKETIQFSFNEPEQTTYSCNGFKICWDINDPICSQ